MKSFALNSLRSQLLLWISLPVLVVLLTFALTGVQGHSQAMHELVQYRADGQARAAAAIIAVRIDHHRHTLGRLAGMPALHHSTLDSAAAEALLLTLHDEFERGIVLFQDGVPLLATGNSDQLHLEAMKPLVRQAATSQTARLATLPYGSDWWLVYAVPVPIDDDRLTRVLLAAMPLDDLDLPVLLRPLALDSSPSQLILANAEGRVMVTLQAGTDSARMDEENSVLALASVEPAGWQVQVRESWVVWIPPVLRVGSMLLLVLVAAAILSILSAYFGLQQIVYPLNRLNRAVSALGQGDFEAVRRPVGGVQEVGELQLALATMAQQIRRYQQELQGYIGAMTMGQEEERKRIARELHDETVQALIVLNQQVEMAEHQLDRDRDRAAERLRELRPIIDETIAGIRRQIHNLRPLYLEDLGFVPALEMLVQQTAAQHGLVGDFDVSGEPQMPTPQAVEVSGYRIVQEALQNVVNHAQARWIHVELIFKPDALVLCIEDDGIGFAAPAHPRQLAAVGHYGLLGMSERARQHGGHLYIESEPGNGTTVIARLPVPANRDHEGND